ncbi:MAG: hypothetical protein ACOCWQ_00480, partial [Nanoarchaeota archaeon]
LDWLSVARRYPGTTHKLAFRMRGHQDYAATLCTLRLTEERIGMNAYGAVVEIENPDTHRHGFLRRLKKTRSKQTEGFAACTQDSFVYTPAMNKDPSIAVAALTALRDRLLGPNGKPQQFSPYFCATPSSYDLQFILDCTRSAKNLHDVASTLHGDLPQPADPYAGPVMPLPSVLPQGVPQRYRTLFRPTDYDSRSNGKRVDGNPGILPA